MLFTALKITVSAIIIAFSSWLAGKKPELAGFIVALPVATMLVLPFSYIEYNDPENSVRFAQSILFAIPISMMFFIPFLLASKLQWGFWQLYTSGICMLVIGYFIHRWITSVFN